MWMRTFPFPVLQKRMNGFIFSVKTQLAYFFQNLKARLFENLNHKDFS